MTEKELDSIPNNFDFFKDSDFEKAQAISEELEKEKDGDELDFEEVQDLIVKTDFIGKIPQPLIRLFFSISILILIIVVFKIMY